MPTIINLWPAFCFDSQPKNVKLSIYKNIVITSDNQKLTPSSQLKVSINAIELKHATEIAYRTRNIANIIIAIKQTTTDAILLIIIAFKPKSIKNNATKKYEAPINNPVSKLLCKVVSFVIFSDATSAFIIFAIFLNYIQYMCFELIIVLDYLYEYFC